MSEIKIQDFGINLSPIRSIPDAYKTPIDFFLERRTLIKKVSLTPAWRLVPAMPKTLLNLCLLTTEEPEIPDRSELKQLHADLGNIFGIGEFGVRREIALYSRDLKKISQSDYPNDAKEKKQLQPVAAGNGRYVESAAGVTYDFNLIYTEHFGNIYNHLYRLTGNSQDAMEGAQEVFLRAWVAFEKHIDPDLKVNSYLHKMARFLAYDQFRRDKLIGFSPLDLVLPEKMVYNPFPDVVESIHKKELNLVVHQAIDELPPRPKLVIKLQDFDGFSGSETAEIMDTTRSAVKSLHFRAVELLRESLKDLKPELTGKNNE